MNLGIAGLGIFKLQRAEQRGVIKRAGIGRRPFRLLQFPLLWAPGIYPSVGGIFRGDAGVLQRSGISRWYFRFWGVPWGAWKLEEETCFNRGRTKEWQGSYGKTFKPCILSLWKHQERKCTPGIWRHCPCSRRCCEEMGTGFDGIFWEKPHWVCPVEL